MNKLATGSSLEKGWEIVKILREATSKWPPKNEFVLVLPEPNVVEVWSWSPQRPSELKFLREVVKDFVFQK
jgi:hypothetical protein